MVSHSKALGRWPNAPLVLVLAQVRYDVSAESECKLLSERIQRVSGQIYVNVSAMEQATLIIGQTTHSGFVPPSAPLGIDLRNSENTQAIRLQPGSMTFTTSAYQDSGDFAREWRILLDALCEQKEVRVNRLGLRYVDFIVPSPGHVPEDYFREGIGRSPPVLGNQAPVAFNLYDFDRGNGARLRIQYSRGFGMPNLPPDLQGMVITPAVFNTRSAIAGMSAVLDMDRWRALTQSMTAERIAKEFDVLQTDISSSFRSVMSDLANVEWKENFKDDSHNV